MRELALGVLAIELVSLQMPYPRDGRVSFGRPWGSAEHALGHVCREVGFVLPLLGRVCSGDVVLRSPHPLAHAIRLDRSMYQSRLSVLAHAL